MPEILEIEYYRRAAIAALDREIRTVEAPDDWYLKGVGAVEVADALGGQRFIAARRRGKLLMLDVTSGPTLGLRFGMTGRLVVDDVAPIEKLEYAPGRRNPDWDRFRVMFVDGGDLVMSDPRRLGGVSLDPDVSKLGPDAWHITAAELAVAIGPSVAPLKARLMDQSRVAGLGNLLTDEILWRAGVNPTRQATTISADEIARIHETIRHVLDELFDRGGSHTGELQGERSASGRCPRDGAELRRETIGGRTTMWCAEHQR